MLACFILGGACLAACSSAGDDQDVTANLRQEIDDTTSTSIEDQETVSPGGEVTTAIQVAVPSGTGSETTTEVESTVGEDQTGDQQAGDESTSSTEDKSEPASQGAPEETVTSDGPDLLFDWTAGAQPTAGSRLTDFTRKDFWIRGINCGGDNEQSHADSTRVTFGVNNYSRFAGERSVEFFTDRSVSAPCNGHLVSHRAEMSLSNNRNVNNAYAKYRNGGGVVTENSPTLGIETGSVGNPGSVVWLGWSERYGTIDTSRTTTLWQLRSNCGTGSPAVALAYRPDDPYGKGQGIYLLTQTANGNVRDNYNFLTPLTTGAWRDFVMEVGYSYEDKSGFVKVWHAEVGSDGRSSFDYDNPAVFRRSATLYGADAPLPSNADNVDECPHMRWGLYRHDGSDVPPEQVPEANRIMTKYVSPVRLSVGRGLGQSGLDAVTPRPIGG